MRWLCVLTGIAEMGVGSLGCEFQLKSVGIE